MPEVPPEGAVGEGAHDPCGAPAEGGPCTLDGGHNMGRADVPENHRHETPKRRYRTMMPPFGPGVWWTCCNECGSCVLDVPAHDRWHDSHPPLSADSAPQGTADGDRP